MGVRQEQVEEEQTMLTKDRTTLATDSERLIALVQDMHWESLPVPVQDVAKQLLIDTIGTIVAGLDQTVSQQVLRTLPSADGIPTVFKLPKAVAAQDLAFLLGTSAHGIELDDGYRQGSVHPGVAVVPALLAAAADHAADGKTFLTALVAGYETITAIAESCHPALRKRGFHPTAVVGPLGAGQAVGKLFGASSQTLMATLGLSASTANGLFSFLTDGGDVKRLHAGQAARSGLISALHAREGIAGPANVLESEGGFFRTFVSDTAAPRLLDLPPDSDWRILDCYIKPHACCRHLQPAFEALASVMDEHDLQASDLKRIHVETYSIAEAHAGLGWSDFASAQLSFKFVLGLAAVERKASLAHFSETYRESDAIRTVADLCTITASNEMDSLYPEHRPARVTVETNKGTFSQYADEASGCRKYPLTQHQLEEKFSGLVNPRLGSEATQDLLNTLRTFETQDNAFDAIMQAVG